MWDVPGVHPDLSVSPIGSLSRELLTLGFRQMSQGIGREVKTFGYNILFQTKKSGWQVKTWAYNNYVTPLCIWVLDL